MKSLVVAWSAQLRELLGVKGRGVGRNGMWREPFPRGDPVAWTRPVLFTRRKRTCMRCAVARGVQCSPP